MELNSKKLHFSFFLLLSSFAFLARAKLHPDPSDYNAFKIIQRDLGIHIYHPSFTTTPCNSPAVSCERRDYSNKSVLKIIRIIYDSEQLDGSVSPVIGQLSELRELSVTNNHLADQLPQEIADCSKLEVLELRNNLFSGTVPSELSKLIHLRVLDLSANKFSGDLSFLKYFPNLEKLSLADNLFAGKIPASLRSFRNLQLFDISGNNDIQGPVPELHGARYPTSTVSTKSIVPRRYILASNSTRNNQSSSRGAGSPAQAPSPSAELQDEHKGKKKLAAWLIGLLIGGGAGFFSGMTFSVMAKVALALLRKSEDKTISLFSSLIKKEEDLAFLEKEDGMSNLQVIGKGGCGEVYKAELPESNGTIIAIKKIILLPEDAEDISEENSKVMNSYLRQIQAEINTIGKIRHRNVLPLLAHVSRPDCHYLIYEFVKNGSLQDIMAQVAEGNSEFHWLDRYNIALGIATGIEYLHMNNSPRIIHRDLKPGNILLDDDMKPRIADFGLAKEMPIGKTHMSTLNVVGTLGYIAPEYHQTSKFTDKSDIYSLGVVLGSLMIGKLPSDQFFQDTQEMHLVTWMRNVMNSEDPTRALDPTLRGNEYEEQMLQLLKVACFCTNVDPKLRPNAKDVRCMLNQINNTNEV